MKIKLKQKVACRLLTELRVVQAALNTYHDNYQSALDCRQANALLERIIQDLEIRR